MFIANQSAVSAQFDLKGLLKQTFNKSILPSLLSFLDMVVKVVIEGTIPKEDLQENPELVAFIYAGLQFADKKLGNDEKAALEIGIDELKEALRNITINNDIPSIPMNWD